MATTDTPELHEDYLLTHVKTVRSMLSDQTFILSLVGILLAGFFAELSRPTFATDFYYDLQWSVSELFAFDWDARYLAALIRNFSANVFPPTLLMIVGLALLCLSALLACAMLKVRHRFAALIACTLLTASPLLFETYSYHSLRLVVPLAVLLSVVAVAQRSVIIGIVCTILTLSLYQSAVYFGVILCVLATAARVFEGASFRAALSYALPRAASVLVGIIAYFLLVKIVDIFGTPAVRFSAFADLASSPTELFATAKTLLAAMRELLWHNWGFFPWQAKALLGLMALALLGFAAYRGRWIAVALIVAAPFFAFGATWLSSDPKIMLADRIVFPFTAVYVGIFLLAWMAAPKARLYTGAVGCLLSAMFIWQANVWHQFLHLKNQADMDLSEDIADRIQSLDGYTNFMPVIVVGKGGINNYAATRLFNTERDLIENTALESVFDHEEWYTSRTLMFYIYLREPNGDEIVSARQTAKTMPSWPQNGSVIIKDGAVIVKLSDNYH